MLIRQCSPSFGVIADRVLFHIDSQQYWATLIFIWKFVCKFIYRFTYSWLAAISSCRNGSTVFATCWANCSQTSKNRGCRALGHFPGKMLITWKQRNFSLNIFFAHTLASLSAHSEEYWKKLNACSCLFNWSPYWYWPSNWRPSIAETRAPCWMGKWKLVYSPDRPILLFFQCQNGEIG